MSENFNVKPYYDDFDPSKNFHRVLFKPGYAVQARELTQSQTILQNQISNFADNIFTQNTPVTGGKVTTNLTCHFLTLVGTYGSTQVKASMFLNADGSGRYITDSATGTVVAKVITALDATSTDTVTLIVSYLSGVQFTDDITIQTNDSGSTQYATTTGTVGGSTCTGLSSVASISKGVFYIVNGYSTTSSGANYSIGNFVQVNPQTIVIGKYSNTPSMRIGLQITESVVDYTSDSTLLDPAIGASNFESPGADRYQITLTLTYLPLSLGNDSNFIELVRIVDGQIVHQVDGTVYSTIDDYFAKRDYETNGDYLVTPFTFTPSANTSHASQYDLSVSKGIAYVHGYRIENQSPLLMTSDRARTSQAVTFNDVPINFGSYLYVDSLNNFFNVSNMPQVDLHCVYSSQIANSSTNTYSSTKIGTAFIRGLEYVADGTSNNWIYKAHVADVNLNSYSSNVATAINSTSITLYDPNNKLSVITNAYLGFTLSVVSGTSAGDVRNVVNYNATEFVVDKPFTLNLDKTSIISISPVVGDIESLVIPGANNTVSSSLNINAAFGKSQGLSSGATILENPATPEMVFKIGNPYVANTSAATYQSVKTFSPGSTGVSGTFNITAGTDVAFIGVAGSAQSAGTIKQYYTVVDTATGLALDYTTSTSSVSLDPSKQTLTFTNSAYANKTVKVIAAVSITSGDSYPILKWKNLVYGTTASVTASPTVVDANTSVDLQLAQTIIQNAATKSGKMSLRVADVKNIVAIYDTGSPSGQPYTGGLSGYTNVTNLYVFDNGQRDNYYDHASIQLLPGANPAAGNLLVIYNYYSHINGTSNLGTGTASDGYFAVASYLNSSNPTPQQSIPNYKAKSGVSYKLADCLDFRPSRVNATTNFAFEYAGSGALMPTDMSAFTSNYAYYLGRKDLLVLSKDKSFQIVEGTPSLNPLFPAQPTGSLLLANLTLDPFTAYVPGENPPGVPSNLSINAVPHNRWVKSDITDLQTRVNNLEYYTSLNLLEQNAQSLQVPDANGINRFKNGILVDDFSSFGAADSFNPDFTANINVRKQVLGPVALVDNYQLQNPNVHNSYGTLQRAPTFAISSLGGTNTNIFTLPYTSANLIVQPLATSDVSLNPFGVTVYQGIANLFPPMDNWVDNIQAPALLITDPNMQVNQQTAGVNMTNSGDFATIPGTAYATSSSTSVVGHNINPSPFGYLGYTATTTNTYASQLQNITSTLNTTTVNSTLNLNNGYLTNISVLPYIRPQQIGFSVKGLLVNTPISVWFDGQNVTDSITLPNTIELTGVSGNFSIGDVVGFFQANTFYPTARVEQTYAYPNTANVRLYVSDVVGAPTYTTTNVLLNASFDGSGQFTTSTAQGTINTGVSRLSSTGYISGVGGGYTINGQTIQIHQIQDAYNWCSFMNQYAVWGDLDRSETYNTSFVVTPQVAGTYTYTYASTGGSTSGGRTILTANGTNLVSTTTSNYKTPATGTFTISSTQVGSPFTIGWNITGGNGTPAGTSGIALVVADSTGNTVFTSTHPPELQYVNATGEVLMPQGGAFFSGVTSLALDQNASGSVSTYYTGAQVTVTSTYVYSYELETATYVPPPPPRHGGGSIICQKLAELGYFSEAMNDADQRFGADLRAKDPAAYIGYLRWARTVVQLMEGKGSEALRKVVFFWQKDEDRRIELQKKVVIYYMDMLARPWAEEMAFRMGAKGYETSNPAGKLIMDVGLPLCRKIGMIQDNKSLPLTAKILIIWAAVSVLLASVFVISGTNAIVNKVKSWFKKPQLKTINN